MPVENIGICRAIDPIGLGAKGGPAHRSPSLGMWVVVILTDLSVGIMGQGSLDYGMAHVDGSSALVAALDWLVGLLGALVTRPVKMPTHLPQQVLYHPMGLFFSYPVGDGLTIFDV